MKRIILALLWCLAGTAAAQEWHIMSLKEFDLDAFEIRNHRDAYYLIPDAQHAGPNEEHWNNGIATDFMIDVAKYGDWGIYWGNRVDEWSTTAQVREVSWKYDLGLQLGPDLDFRWEHHSRHLMDDHTQSSDRFPLDNTFNLRFVFYRRNDASTHNN